MSVSSSPDSQYQTGGSLPSGSSSYVVRQADRDLYAALLKREYCYILNARQMGKSSLRIRTMNALKDQGIACADIELTGIGSQQITASQWYGGIIQELVSGFELIFKRRSWLQAREDLSPVQRLSQFIETVLLVQVKEPIVIFIDEIDSVLGLSFPTDEFFALIRNCYDKRATKPDYQRLTFALLGVAAPSDLIRDKHYAAPFNIGRAIFLNGFQPEESTPLLAGLANHFQYPEAVLQEILYWTGGQPFLTQKLCFMVTQSVRSDDAVDQPFAVLTSILESSTAASERSLVKALVQERIIENWEGQDEPEHLRTIRDRLLRVSNSQKKVLELYLKVLRQGGLPVDDTPETFQLRLSGIVDIQNGQLKVKNPIYAKIFNLDWVHDAIAKVSLVSTAPTKAAIVFTDIESFTAKMIEDEQHVMSLVKRDFAILKQYCQQFDGRLSKSVGDGLLITFETSEAAVQWAIESQKALSNAATRLPAKDILWHRIGIHTGDVFFDGQDVMGTGVNIASRLQRKSPAGGICISQEVYRSVSRHLTVDVVDLGEQEVKGLSEPMRVYQIPPQRMVPRKQRHWWDQWPVAVLAGAIATGAIIGIRTTGLLQPLELLAFDQAMRARPAEEPDDRFVIVTVTEKDVQAQSPDERGGSSLSDRALAELLEKLNQGEPRVIGLDIYREESVDPAFPGLVETLAQNDRFFSICQYGDPGVPPPPEISEERQGFNNVPMDADSVLRRQILAVGESKPCQSLFSLNWVLASRYLADKGITPVPAEYMQFGETPFPGLTSNIGGYQNINASGQQILVNYRATPEIAKKVALSEVLSENFDPKIVQDRIVLIGTVASSFNDHQWITPYSGGWKYREPMAGVEVQTHMTSQLISAVLDGRPLIWSWSEPVEILWIGSWTLLASLIAINLRSRRLLSLYLGGLVMLLGGSCWVFICFGGWIPFVPAALGIAAGGLIVNTYRQTMATRVIRGRSE
jgi:CHASE2 domain-containing sensor protein/class 3 adenylate cyclase